MKFTHTARALALLAIATLAQAASAQSSDERRSREEQAIRAVGAEWQQALAARDIDKVIALHAPDAIYMLSHAPLISGTAAIRAGWGEALKLPNYKVQWTPTKIDVVSPNVATEYGTYTESYTGADGKLVNDGGNYVTIWHKINGQWRVAIDNPNTTTPLPAPAASGALSDSDRAAVEAAVRQATKEFVDAATHVDADRAVAFFTRSPAFAVADNGAFLTSREQFQNAIVGAYNGLQSQEVQIGETRIVALAPDKAVESLTGTVVRVDKSGTRSPPQTFSWTVVWVREPDGWKILHGHESFLPKSQ
ncbi:MAG TPA: nuclear transport factor 2 family protein [Gemmatimonadaceae bacterium]|nr:nuclear transport factor 2 family protein [Gemmatimonadaceae bacterium]